MRTGSPGIILLIAKSMTEIANTTGMRMMMRLTMYLSISFTYWE
jgi:hypothetical protein